MVEPPPVYSSLTAIDKIQLREVDKKKKKKRGLFLSPFTCCIRPKNFATIHASMSLSFCTIICTIMYAIYEQYVLLALFLFVCCLPPIPFFISAILGIERKSPNFVLAAAVYMVACFVILFPLTVIWICINIPYMFSEDAKARAYSRFFTIPVIKVMPPILLYNGHAARVYLRAYYDIRDETKERKEEIKLPLVK